MIGSGIGRTILTCTDSEELNYLSFDEFDVEGISFHPHVNVLRGTIKGNEFLNGLAIRGPGVIKNNSIQNGLIIAEVSYLTVEGNHISDAYHGVQVWESDHVSIRRNHIYGNEVGIMLYAPQGVDISENLIERNGYGILTGFNRIVGGVFILQNDLLDNQDADIGMSGMNIDWDKPVSILIDQNHCYGDPGTIFLLSTPEEIVGQNPDCGLDIHYGM